MGFKVLYSVGDSAIEAHLVQLDNCIALWSEFQTGPAKGNSMV
jgi:hypothetical protein